MKRAFFLLLAFIGLAGCASQQPLPKSERQYQKIVDVSGSKQELYTRTLEWLARSFGSSKEVIQFSDPDQAKVIGKGIMKVNYTITPVDTHFTLTIEIRDNRARFTFDQLYTEPNATLLPERMFLENRAQMEKFSIRASMLIEDWKKYVSNNTDNW